MRAKTHTLAAVLLLANYVLAVTVGAEFHAHGGHDCAGHGGGGASGSGYRLPGCRGNHASDRPGFCPHNDGVSGASSPRWQHDPAECLICQFLAQKPIPALQVEQSGFTPLGQNLVRMARDRRAPDAPSSYDVRAPPVSA